LIPKEVRICEPTDREIQLPAGVGFILLGECLPDRQALLVGLKHLQELALGHQHIANLFVTDREIPLPAGVGFILLGECLGDRQTLLVGPQRLLELTLGHQHIANLFVAER